MGRSRNLTVQPRYRVERGEPCVDVKIGSIEQLFDNRDPAPFRGRDLDPGLVEYLIDAGEDLIGEKSIRVVFWLANASPPREIEEAFHAHFEYMLERIHRGRRQHRRTGQVALVVAILLFAALLTFAQVIAKAVPGALGTGLHEGLVILSWVVMWRPVEVLLYDWIPTRHELKVVSKLREAAIDVRVGKGPEVPPFEAHA
jgi:hypothetical protein